MKTHFIFSKKRIFLFLLLIFSFLFVLNELNHEKKFSLGAEILRSQPARSFEFSNLNQLIFFRLSAG